MKRGEHRVVKAHRSAKVWITGQLARDWAQVRGAWEFQGVFDSRAKADRACRTARYFYFSTEMNKELPAQTVVAPDCCYPRCQADTPQAANRAEIKRIIGNRHFETHPFKRCSAGMEWFSRMLPLVSQLTKEETDEFLIPMLDELLQRLTHCIACRAKLLVFSELYCSQKRTRKAALYWKEYWRLLSHQKDCAEQRDYRTEVYEAVELYGEQGRRG